MPCNQISHSAFLSKGEVVPLHAPTRSTSPARVCFPRAGLSIYSVGDGSSLCTQHDSANPGSYDTWHAGLDRRELRTCRRGSQILLLDAEFSRAFAHRFGSHARGANQRDEERSAKAAPARPRGPRRLEPSSSGRGDALGTQPTIFCGARCLSAVFGRLKRIEGHARQQTDAAIEPNQTRFGQAFADCRGFSIACWLRFALKRGGGSKLKSAEAAASSKRKGRWLA